MLRASPLSVLHSDEVLALGLLVAFASFVTAHVWIIWGLLWRRLWWRGLLALPLAPLAPYWGARAGLHPRVVLWVTSAIAYGVLWVVARF